MDGGDTTITHHSHPLHILTIFPLPTPPLQKHKYSSKVSHMQCPLTIGFTSSDLSLAYFLRQGGGGKVWRGKGGERKLQLPAPCFRPSSVHQRQLKQKGMRRLRERTQHIPCKEKRDRKNPSTQILCSQYVLMLLSHSLRFLCLFLRLFASVSLSQFIFFIFFPSSLLSKKMGFVSPFSPSGLCFASSDNPVAAQADPRWPDSQITSHSPLQVLEKGGARSDAPP